ncbi:MAG: cyclic-di-AMP receptor [Armatimonadetes bacterium]|nr:cyclic-di-AMP receptor [Armatimonadota bacterium]
MKLVVAVVHSCDKNRVVEDLVRNGFKFTIIGSTGGFLREGNTTFLVGVEDGEKDALISLIQQNCKAREQMVNVLPPDASPVGTFVPSPIKVPVGGAIAFVLDVEQFERF